MMTLETRLTIIELLVVINLSLSAVMLWQAFHL